MRFYYYYYFYFIIVLLFHLVSLSFGEGWGEDKKISLVFSDKAY